MSDPEPLPEDDPDVQRIMRIVRQGLAHARHEAPDQLRLDTFVIATMWVYDDENGVEREGPGVWGESKRQYVKRGVLEVALERMTWGDAEPDEDDDG